MIYWPKTLVPLSPTADPVHRTLGGVPTLLGLTQHVVSSAGLWSVVYTGVAVNTPERILAWRAIQAQTEGRANPLVVPIPERSALRPVARTEGTPFSDNATFSDASLFAGGTGVTVDAADRQAVDLVLRGDVSLVTAGHRFSIGDRLYVIRSADEPSGGVVSVRIWPWLREAVPDGAEVDFQRPRCTVKLATDGELDLPLVALQSASPTVRFLEDVP